MNISGVGMCQLKTKSLPGVGQTTKEAIWILSGATLTISPENRLDFLCGFAWVHLFTQLSGFTEKVNPLFFERLKISTAACRAEQ